ncbi:hypothetical protein FA95DRAFT_1045442 [Auriscalpium vulgare]|uniref:Uncharacterized protein n=1 Tax=Auriscalpium vulgare TaxID=40419 RepID=A0ACB8SAH0_9AGAM|nr:hypothetical protein FA95DRAFT_1045442 [Auriscalpium vulgare]
MLEIHVDRVNEESQYIPHTIRNDLRVEDRPAHAARDLPSIRGFIQRDNSLYVCTTKPGEGKPRVLTPNDVVCVSPPTAPQPGFCRRLSPRGWLSSSPWRLARRPIARRQLGSAGTLRPPPPLREPSHACLRVQTAHHHSLNPTGIHAQAPALRAAHLPLRRSLARCGRTRPVDQVETSTTLVTLRCPRGRRSSPGRARVPGHPAEQGPCGTLPSCAQFSTARTGCRDSFPSSCSGTEACTLGHMLGDVDMLTPRLAECILQGTARMTGASSRARRRSRAIVSRGRTSIPARMRMRGRRRMTRAEGTGAARTRCADGRAAVGSFRRCLLL